jgi:hypothetical protein
MAKGKLEHLEGKRGRLSGGRNRPKVLRDMEWAYRNMGTPLVGELDTDGKKITEKTPRAITTESDGAKAWWRFAQRKPDSFINLVFKRGVQNEAKSGPESKDPQPEKTQAATELIDKVLADWQAGKRG